MTNPAPDFAVGGTLSLDLTWTLRFRAVQPTELLTDTGALGRWLNAQDLPSAPANETDVRRAIALREAIFAVASARVDGAALPAQARRRINNAADHAVPVLHLRVDGTSTRHVPRGREIDAALAVIARDAVEVLTGPRERLRRCEGPRCALLFLDTSRNGRRRWCDMKVCGNRAKNRAFHRRAARSEAE